MAAKTRIRNLVGAMGVSFLYISSANADPNVGSPTSLPFYVGPLEQTLMAAAAKTANQPNATYILPATAGTTQCGSGSGSSKTRFL